MEEIVAAINNVAESLKNSTPAWVSVVGVLVPIVLTVVSIILSVRMDKNNQQMQKMLANRDMMNQTRQSVLDIYNSYFNGFMILTPANGNIAEIFTSDQSYYRWAQDIENASKDISQAYNRAKLLLEDEELLCQLSDAQTAFYSLDKSVRAYIFTGIPSQTVSNAWNQFSGQHSVAIGNYVALFQNRALGEVFIKLCENTYTKDIQEKVTAYLELVQGDKFDKPFKKYVQIKEL